MPKGRPPITMQEADSMSAPYDDRCTRTLNAAQDSGAVAALAADTGTVRWLSGMQAYIEVPLGPWAAGTYVLVAPGGNAVICAEEDSTGAPDGFTLYTY